MVRVARNDIRSSLLSSHKRSQWPSDEAAWWISGGVCASWPRYDFGVAQLGRVTDDGAAELHARGRGGGFECCAKLWPRGHVGPQQDQPTRSASTSNPIVHAPNKNIYIPSGPIFKKNNALAVLPLVSWWIDIEALCAAPPETLAHSPSQMPLSCRVAPQAARS